MIFGKNVSYDANCTFCVESKTSIIDTQGQKQSSFSWRVTK